jgi:hypothetical protein
MYSIDGVPLQNTANGWRLKRSSEPRVSRSFTRATFQAAGRDGTASVRGYAPAPTMTLVVSTPAAGLEALLQLMTLGGSVSLTADPGKVYAVEAITVTPVTIAIAGTGVYEVTAVYRIPGVWMRDAATTDWIGQLAANAGVGSVNLAVLTASSAPVRDAKILVQGAIASPKFLAQNGTWVSFTGTTPTQANGGALMIDTARSRCWVNPSGGDLWGTAGAYDQSGSLNFGAYPYALELAPSSTALGATLTLSWASVNEPATVTIRAANAYNR